MKTLFTLLFICIAAIVSAQVPLQFQPNLKIVEPLFPQQKDSVAIRTLSMLSKVDVTQISVALPSDYDWSQSLRRRQAIRNYALEYRPQDANGRDIQRPLIEKLTTELYYKNLPTNLNANRHY